MDSGYIKVFRKVLENGILRDAIAWQIFTWILLRVNRKTGKMTTGRFAAAEDLDLNSNTFYSALQRLTKKWKVTTLTSNNKYTEISVINWAKYQNMGDSSTQSGNNAATTPQQPDNTIQELRSKELRKIQKPEDDANRVGTSQKVIKKNGEQKIFSPVLVRLISHLETTLHTKVANVPRQGKAMSMMLSAGYTEGDICRTITYMATKDEFFSDKGFDLMTVANTIMRYKAEVEKARGGGNYDHD